MAETKDPSQRRLNPDKLVLSLERLSLFDNANLNRLLQAARSIDFEQLIGTLDVDEIQSEM